MRRWVGAIIASAVSTSLEAGTSHRMSLATTLDSILSSFNVLYDITIHTVTPLALPTHKKQPRVSTRM